MRLLAPWAGAPPPTDPSAQLSYEIVAVNPYPLPGPSPVSREGEATVSAHSLHGGESERADG